METCIVSERIRESIDAKRRMLEDRELLGLIEKAAGLMKASLEKGGKILFCGNGGSASDSLHLAGEIIGRFRKERRAMAAVSLNADVASLTAVANDYGYDCVFSRAVEGLMKPEDVLVGISSSGNSENVYRAVLRAKEIGGCTVALLGRDGGKIKGAADVPIVVPGGSTARIQEAHIMVGHILCELVEG